MNAASEALMRLDNLSVAFAAGGLGGQRRFNAVDAVSLEIRVGEVLGIVGESGSGKTTLAKTMLRLHRPSAGRILYRDADLAALSERALRPYRRDLQMVFQDPLSSFNPRHSVAEALATPLRLHRLRGRAAVAAEVDRMLVRVGLTPAFRDRYPHELSGGQLQRVAIGRALILAPRLLVADEAVSKLDVSIRAQILNLLGDIRASEALSILFITHDLHVARYLCDRIGVMYFGRLVELGTAEQVFSRPRHPYTRALLGTLDDTSAVDAETEGLAEAPSPTGCRYATRCPHRIARCADAQPPLAPVEAGHAAACLRLDELDAA